MGKVRDCKHNVPSLRLSACIQLAAHKQTTIRQIHGDYGLTNDD